MCNLSDSVEEKGIQKGIHKNQLLSVKALMDTMKLSEEEALAALRIPKADWEKCRKLVTEQASKLEKGGSVV